MNVRVLFFAAIREQIGCTGIDVELPGSTSKCDFMSRLETEMGSERFRCLTAENVSIAVNQVVQSGDFEIAGGDEIAFMPPITGG